MDAKRRDEIEYTVRKLQFEIWTGAKLKYAAGLPPLPQLFAPDAAIENTGFSFEIRDSMPSAFRRQDNETAGMIDNVRQIVSIRSGLKYEVQRFTAAHELGHLVLHQAHLGTKLHRDRSLSGFQMGIRPPLEQEADLFAALWLAPSKTVTTEFKARFGAIPIILNEDAAYWLVGQNGAHDLLASNADSLAFPMAVAQAEKFGRKRFTSLAKFFGMSPTAMAIRLQELNLVAY
jgi:hypothetical protein